MAGVCVRHWNLRSPQASRDLSVIEAPDERMEALAIAVALRAVLETPEKTAALVTPDRAPGPARFA